MENRGLLFIPDISGFTRFINAMEVEHSRLIIQELLEVLVSANELDLQISEIEGDAILFYKYGDSPDLKEIYRQVEKMFCDFHRSLIGYDYRRFCQCQACTSAIDLTLKVITHFGEFTDYHVRNFQKLIGKDVIIAHQLLKNDIGQQEYWLVTNNIVADKTPDDITSWMDWNSSIKKTESGDISFYYTPLSELKKDIKPAILPQLELKNKTKVFSITKEYSTDIITLFHATGDFNFKSRWQDGVKEVEEVNHFLPRVGMKCRCIMEDGQSVIYSSSYSYEEDKIEFSETDDLKKSLTYYTLEKTGEDRTRLTLDLYVPKSIGAKTVFNLLEKKKTETAFHKSLLNLETLVTEIDFRVNKANT